MQGGDMKRHPVPRALRAHASRILRVRAFSLLRKWGSRPSENQSLPCRCQTGPRGRYVERHRSARIEETYKRRSKRRAKKRRGGGAHAIANAAEPFGVIGALRRVRPFFTMR